MQMFPTKCLEHATLRKLWRQTMTGKQFTVTREMLTAVARNKRVQLQWTDDVPGISVCFSKFAFVLFCYNYNKSLNNWSQWTLFPLNPNVSLQFVLQNIEILGKKIHCFPWDQSLSVKCYWPAVYWSAIASLLELRTRESELICDWMVVVLTLTNYTCWIFDK